MDKRFERTKLLIGENDLENIVNSKAAVIGCGGVGGFVIEASARCGVGTLAIVDYDTTGTTNINRQIIVLEDTVGNYKVDEFEKRIHNTNPNRKVIKLREKSDKFTVDFFNLKDYNYVMDATDLISVKLGLAECYYKNDTKLISSMGAGSKLNPFLFRTTDIKKTHTCPVAKVMKRELKRRDVNRLTCIWLDEERLGEVLPANGRNASASISLVPSCVGSMIASYVIQELRQLSMAKEGTATKTESTKASVLITRKDACGGEGCSKCSGCEHQIRVIECANYISVKIGDRVQIFGDDPSVPKYTALLYLVPLIFFPIALISSYSILENKIGNFELASSGIGLVGLLTGYIIVKLIDKRSVDKDLVHITKIIGGLYE